MEIFTLIFYIIYLLLYLFYSYAKYLLSKKLDIKYPWMAFVPVLHIVNLLWLGGKTFWWGMKWIGSFFIVFILNSIIQWLGMAGFINIPGAGLATGVAVIAILGLSLYLPIIIMHGISKRTGHGGWWTAGLFFVYPIFFPVTAFHYEKGDEIKPRPFTGIKKFFLILAATIGPIILIIGILAAALFPSLTTYLSRGRDTARMSGIKEISTGLMAYQIDNGKYPTTPTGGCIPIKDLNTVLYSKSTIIDPIKKLTPGCDGSDGQTYAYRTGTASNGKTYIVLGAKMESSRSGNSNESIDAITPDTVLVRGKGNMYYVVDSSF